MSSDASPPAPGPSDGKPPSSIRDGDTLRLPPQQVLGTERKGRALTVEWEIEVATGERAKRLDQVQSAAIWDLLVWATQDRARQE
jgi:hypothetical protein